MKQQSLIALYGHKEASFQDYLQRLLSLIQDAFPGMNMKGYLPEQIHGTLIGLEAKVINGIPYNLNILEKEGRKCRMKSGEIPGLLMRYFPMKIRFGGFPEEYDSFMSRSEKPFYRSFRVDLNNKRVLIIGWPHEENDFSGSRLWKFREAMRHECNTAHKYEYDNDFYMVLGEVTAEKVRFSESQILDLEQKIRKLLEHNPIDVTVNEVLRAEYTDPRLPPLSTRISRV